MIEFFQGTLCLILFLIPGYLIATVLRTPLRLVVGFGISSLLFFLVMLALESLGIPLYREIVCSTFLGISIGIAAFIRLKGIQLQSEKVAPESEESTNLLPFYGVALITLIAGLSRALRHPFFGFDTDFRWMLLAKQIFAKNTFAFYPPFNHEDFFSYYFVDGIPPMVSFLYFFPFSVLGKVDDYIALPFIVIQPVLLYLLTYAMAKELIGRKGAAVTCCVLGSSSLFIWAILMGQETGLTALGMIGMVYFLIRSQRVDPLSLVCVVIAAVFASVAALSREYALSFPFLGFLYLLFKGKSLKQALVFCLCIIVFALPWYFRSLMKTGNPVYSLSMGGLFPANLFYEGFISLSKQENALGWHRVDELIKAMVLGALFPFIGFGWALLRGWKLKEKCLLFGAPCLLMFLWLWSIPHTAGGISYSSRVLAPIIPLLAICFADQYLKLRKAYDRALVIVLSLYAVFGFLLVQTLPLYLNRFSAQDWFKSDQERTAFHTLSFDFTQIWNKPPFDSGDVPVYTAVSNAWEDAQALNVPVVSCFSPEFDFVFNTADIESMRQEFMRLGVHYVLLSRGSYEYQLLIHTPLGRGDFNLFDLVYGDGEIFILKVRDAAKQ